jgi:hypothetical protein
MFIVLNKEKMIAYGISVLTVIMLFGLANISLIKQDTIETSSNIQAQLPIYNVETLEKKVAFTMNCAW